MKAGDIAMVVPPSDIHSFEAMTEGTFALSIVGGEYSPLRHYYNLQANTYAVRTPGCCPYARRLEGERRAGWGLKMNEV